MKARQDKDTDSTGVLSVQNAMQVTSLTDTCMGKNPGEPPRIMEWGNFTDLVRTLKCAANYAQKACLIKKGKRTCEIDKKIPETCK